MRVVALVSGGKDSCYNMMQCAAAGHTIVALANLQPIEKDEMDSYMYQTVGHQGIDLFAQAMDLPLYREYIKGEAIDKSRNYKPTENDEVEDLYRLLAKVKEDLDVEAVSVGAILSDYQRIRVENVCHRLGLVSLAYLWRRNQKELLKEMIDSGVEAIIIKTAALGLDPRTQLGMRLRTLRPQLLAAADKFGLHACGEGGEYETFTLDCPLFSRRLVVDEKEMVIHTDDPVAPVGYLNLKLHLEPKENFTVQLPPTVKSSVDFVSDVNDTVFSDLSDIELSESEVESIEKLEKEEREKQKELNPSLRVEEFTEVERHLIDGAENGESIGYLYEIDESEPHVVEDHSSIFGNEQGWFFIGGVVGRAEDTACATEMAINKLINLLNSQELRLQDVCSVNLYMRDMNEYAALNAVYATHFHFENPPTRVCVQVPLPRDVGLILDAVAHKSMPEPESGPSDGSLCRERRTLHVQSVSHWAPANIGPYSQAVKVGEIIGTCGQIALVPGSMRLAAGGARRQCALALRHLARVLRASHPRAHFRAVLQCVCYISASSETQGSLLATVHEARRQLERRTAGALAQYVVVDRLPRAAALEWHAWAHTDNCRFHYEETGCNIGEYKVAITRRWNYENTVAAFVCYVATGSSCASSSASSPGEARGHETHVSAARAMRAEDVRAVLEYALGKLLAGGREARPAVQLRIFYQLHRSPPGVVLTSAGEQAGARLSCGAAVTAVPVRALHDARTFLSIHGLRLHE